MVPVALNAPEPISIDVKPEVIDPAFRAPTVTTFATVVMEAWVALVTVLNSIKIFKGD